MPAPVITYPIGQDRWFDVWLGQSITISIRASNNPTSFGFNPIPPGMIWTLDTISGTPEFPAHVTTGWYTYNIMVTAINADGRHSSYVFITVKDPDSPPPLSIYYISRPE